MKIPSKRLIKWVIVVFLAIIVVIAAIQVGKLLLFRYTSLWQYAANYEECADDFNVVKNYVRKEFPGESDKILFVSNNDSVGRGIGLFNTDTLTFLQLPSDVRSSLERIWDNGFSHKDAKFDVIRIQGDRIFFGIENGQYALVYSPNEKPAWVNSPNEDDAVKVRSIGDGWYHVTRNPG